MLNLKKIGFLLFLLLIASRLSFAESEKEKDFAVPAFSDLQLLGTQSQNMQSFPVVPHLRWLDLNQDRMLNDFDAKQFESIIESLRGERLTGLQLALKFRAEQKNQRESFPLLYDLDHDGMFTTFDVDTFTETIDHLDSGNLRGSDLEKKFKTELLPKEK